MLNTTETTRYTATLPVCYLNELKSLAQSKKIPSVNFAIRQALDEYMTQLKKKQYDDAMREAAQDKAFVKRTMRCSDDFGYADSEVQGEW